MTTEQISRQIHEIAWGASKNPKNCFFSTQLHPTTVKKKKAKMKIQVAIARKDTCVPFWHMLSKGRTL